MSIVVYELPRETVYALKLNSLWNLQRPQARERMTFPIYHARGKNNFPNVTHIDSYRPVFLWFSTYLKQKDKNIVVKPSSIYVEQNIRNKSSNKIILQIYRA